MLRSAKSAADSMSRSDAEGTKSFSAAEEEAAAAALSVTAADTCPVAKGRKTSESSNRSWEASGSEAIGISLPWLWGDLCRRGGTVPLAALQSWIQGLLSSTAASGDDDEGAGGHRMVVNVNGEGMRVMTRPDGELQMSPVHDDDDDDSGGGGGEQACLSLLPAEGRRSEQVEAPSEANRVWFEPGVEPSMTWMEAQQQLCYVSTPTVEESPWQLSCYRSSPWTDAYSRGVFSAPLGLHRCSPSSKAGRDRPAAHRCRGDGPPPLHPRMSAVVDAVRGRSWEEEKVAREFILPARALPGLPRGSSSPPSMPAATRPMRAMESRRQYGAGKRAY